MAFPPSKLYALFLIIFISTTPPILACGPCSTPKKGPSKPGILPPVIIKPPITIPPVTVPPVTVPPVTVPPVTVPPVTVPPVIIKPPITLPPILKPPITLPPILKPPIILPPILKPPIILPPVITPPVIIPPVLKPPSAPCPPTATTCPIDVLKLGSCVDLLGGLVHIGLGDPAVNKCCPVLSGLAELEAAVCLCTTIKLKALGINLVLPVALDLLASCGKTPPPGFTCPS